MYQISSLGRVRSLDRYVNSSGGRQQYIKGKILRICYNKRVNVYEIHLKKNNKIPNPDYIVKIEERNKRIQQVENNIIIQTDFDAYSDGLIERMWKYAKLSGVKEYTIH